MHSEQQPLKHGTNSWKRYKMQLDTHTHKTLRLGNYLGCRVFAGAGLCMFVISAPAQETRQSCERWRTHARNNFANIRVCCVFRVNMPACMHVCHCFLSPKAADAGADVADVADVVGLCNMLQHT